MSKQMTDDELLAWLDQHGTEVTREELESNYWRLEAAVAAREASPAHGAAQKNEWRATKCETRMFQSWTLECRELLNAWLETMEKSCMIVACGNHDLDAHATEYDSKTVVQTRRYATGNIVILMCSDVHVPAPWPSRASSAGNDGVQTATDNALFRIAHHHGDRQPVEELIRRHVPRAYKTAAHYAGDLGVAKDVVRDAFAVALATPCIAGGPHGFQRGLFSALVERGRMELGKRKNDCAQLVAYESIALAGATRHLHNSANSTALAAAVERLSAPVREVVYLWETGLQDNEIAEVLCKPVGSVRKARNDAVEDLRRMLTDDHVP